MTITSTLGVTLGAGVPSLTPQEFARDSVILYDHAAMIAERFRRELVPIVTYMKKEGSKLIEKEHAFLGRTELHYLSSRSLGIQTIPIEEEEQFTKEAINSGKEDQGSAEKNVEATKSSGEDANPNEKVIKSVKEATKPMPLDDGDTRLANDSEMTTAELTQTTDDLLNSVKEAPKPEEDIINPPTFDPLFDSTSFYKLPYRE